MISLFFPVSILTLGSLKVISPLVFFFWYCYRLAAVIILVSVGSD